MKDVSQRYYYSQTSDESMIMENAIVKDEELSFVCAHCLRKTGKIAVSYNYSVFMKSEDEDIDANIISDKIIPQFIPGFNIVKLYCPKCNKETLHAVIDYNISDIIVALNKIGLRTTYCCEGHDTRHQPYIAFETDIEKCKCILGNELKYWFYDDIEHITNDSINAIIRVKEDITVKEYLDRVYLDELREIIKINGVAL